MAYLTNSNDIVLPKSGNLFEGYGVDDLLSIDMEAYGVKPRATIDVVLASQRHQVVETTRENMWACLELKKSDNNRRTEILLLRF